MTVRCQTDLTLCYRPRYRNVGDEVDCLKMQWPGTFAISLVGRTRSLLEGPLAVLIHRTCIAVRAVLFGRPIDESQRLILQAEAPREPYVSLTLTFCFTMLLRPIITLRVILSPHAQQNASNLVLSLSAPNFKLIRRRCAYWSDLLRRISVPDKGCERPFVCFTEPPTRWTWDRPRCTLHAN